MDRFEHLAKELHTVVPFNIKYKDESWEMQVLNLFVIWFCPNFLTQFTTVIGNTIYFPSRAYVRWNPDGAMRTLAHEVVHILDMDKWTPGFFMGAYLFPQILALGVFTFPFFGLWSLLFLIFLLPIPAPFRYYFEARGYAMDVLTAHPGHRAEMVERSLDHFTGWNYYKMYPFEEQVREAIKGYVVRAEAGEDKDLMKVLLVYELVAEN